MTTHITTTYTKPTRTFDSDTEVRTRSVPAAGHLICMGFEPLRIIIRPGARTLVFSPAAREAIDAFFTAKGRVDAMLETAEEEAR